MGVWYTRLDVGYQSVGKLKRLFVCCVIAVFTILLTADYLLDARIREEIEDAQTINRAGRQRMLAQQIAKKGLILATGSTTSHQSNEARHQLRQVLQNWKVGQHRLVQSESDPQMIARFTRMRPHYEVLMRSAHVLTSPDLDKQTLRRAIQTLLRSEQPYVSAMDEAVFEYEKRTIRGLQEARRTEQTAFFALCAVLAVMTFLVLWPAVAAVERSVARQIVMQNKLRDQKQELETHNEELHASQQELAEIAERLARANALFESAAKRFEYLFQGLPAACLSFDVDGRLREWNEAANVFFGPFRAPVMDQPLEELLRCSNATKICREIFQRVLTGEAIPPQQVTLTPPDGLAQHILASMIPLRSAEGEIVGAIAALMDLTPYAEAQQARERLLAILEATPDMIAMGTADRQLIFLNQAFRDALGIGEDESLESSLIRSARPDWANRLLLEEAIPYANEHGIWRGEAAFIGSDGTEIPTSQVVIAHRGPNGSVEYWSSICRDISDRKRVERELLEKQRFIQEIAESSPNYIYLLNIADGSCVYCNRAVHQLFGSTLEEIQSLGGALLMTIVHPDDLPTVLKGLAEFPQLEEGQFLSSEYRVRNSSGEYRWVAVREVVFTRDEEGCPLQILGVAQDVTEMRQFQEQLERKMVEIEEARQELEINQQALVGINTALRTSEEHVRAVLESAVDGIVTLNEDGLIETFNPAAERIFNYAAIDVVGTKFNVLMPEPYRPQYDGHLWPQERKMIGTGRELQGQRKDGTVFPMEVSISEVKIGGRRLFTAILRDISDRKQAEQALADFALELEARTLELEEANGKLEALAVTDGLTGLRNHRAFQDRLEEEFFRAKRHDAPLSLVLLDVDYFKAFNDTFGHPEGDKVLKVVAEALLESCRQTDLVARYGGEEFVVVLPETDADGARLMAERIREAVESKPWDLRSVTVSVGVTSLKPTTASRAEMIAEADAALYASKRNGRNRITHYDDLSIADAA